jgi:hypothetical protein
MASSSFTDSPVPDDSESDNKSVTIVINDNGEINYDEKTLQSIIGKTNKLHFFRQIKAIYPNPMQYPLRFHELISGFYLYFNNVNLITFRQIKANNSRIFSIVFILRCNVF